MIPGFVLSFFAAKEVFPFLDKRIPAWLAVYITYVYTAYILIPAVTRLVRTVFKPQHIPLYSVTPDGFASDPVNIGLVGTEQQMVSSMEKAGWYRADERTPKTMLRLVMSIIFRTPYERAPFSNLYLFGRRHDIGFEKPVTDDPSHRHHVRFWACKYGSNPEFHGHVRFWHKLHNDKNMHDDTFLWVGCASLDTGIGIIRHNFQLTHSIHANTDRERDLIVKDLQNAKQARKVNYMKSGEPYKIQNRVIGGHMRSDGGLTVVELK